MAIAAGIIMVALGGFVAGALCGAVLVWRRLDSERHAWEASGVEIERVAVEAQQAARDLRADNIRLLDQKMSAS
jgi:hypothetical protein